MSAQENNELMIEACEMLLIDRQPLARLKTGYEQTNRKNQIKQGHENYAQRNCHSLTKVEPTYQPFWKRKVDKGQISESRTTESISEAARIPQATITT